MNSTEIDRRILKWLRALGSEPDSTYQTNMRSYDQAARKAAEVLGVPANTIRDRLRAFEQEGLVEIVPRPGYSLIYFARITEDGKKELRSETGLTQQGTPTVFVSCGQVTAEEVELGATIAEIINQETPVRAYFAENQASLESVSSHILASLSRCVGFVGIMHNRGLVTSPGGTPHERASVWIEQEIAIAAYRIHMLNETIPVQLYIQRGIKREGLRDKLMLNPTEFDTNAEVIAHFRSVVRDLFGARSAGANSIVVESVAPIATVDQARITFSGSNLDRVASTVAGGQETAILFSSPAQLDVAVPVGFHGKVVLTTTSGETYARECDLRVGPDALENASQVNALSVPLYSDENCSVRIAEFVGLLTDEARVGQYYKHIYPVRSTSLKLGDFIRLDYRRDVAVGPAWYHDPITGEIRVAWSSSLMMEPHLIAHRDDVPLTQLIVLPNVASMAKGEARTLVARGVFSRDNVRLEKDISAESSWLSVDESIATVASRGILKAHNPGVTQVNCRFRDLSAGAQVRVESHLSRDKVTYFEGLRRVSQIDFDANDNMYISNQSESIFRIRRDGGVEAVLSLARNDNAPQGIDCLHLSSDGRLFVNSIGMQLIQVFEKRGEVYEAVGTLGAGRDGPKKCVATLNGTVYIGGMATHDRSGFVVIAAPRAEEVSFSTRGLVIYLCVDDDGRIYTTDNSLNGIDVYSREGALIENIAYPAGESAGPILFDDSHRMHIGTAKGNIWRLTRHDAEWNKELIVRGLGMVTGLAINSLGYEFAADFTSGRVSMVYP